MDKDIGKVTKSVKQDGYVIGSDGYSVKNDGYTIKNDGSESIEEMVNELNKQMAIVEEAQMAVRECKECIMDSAVRNGRYDLLQLNMTAIRRYMGRKYA